MVNRCQVPIRKTDSLTYADVLASYKTHGYTLLLHRMDWGYAATYAPTGLRVGGPYGTIEQTLDEINLKAPRLAEIIKSMLKLMENDYIPLLAPETGLMSFDWRWREQCRFDSGEYQPVPIINGLKYPQEHYLHLSVTKTETDFVAYTPNENKAKIDKQERIRFGRYLKKTFPDMADQAIQDCVMKLRSKLALDSQPATLHFATDRETITEIFETEMYACDSTYVSCMHGKFTDEVRPYHVYADSPDVAVAYVKAQGVIKSRSVVSTKDHTYVRLYAVRDENGNNSTECETLKTLLFQVGYKRGELDGNRLTKLKGPGGSTLLMFPYIDSGGKHVVDAGNYWEVAEQGDYECSQTDGSYACAERHCSQCENTEDNCSCIYCECCEESYAESCNRCEMCPICDGCTEHDNCSCSRCNECNEVLEVPVRLARRVTACSCERCHECDEVTRNCECEFCAECEELESNCTCAEEGDDNGSEAIDTTGNASLSASS